MAYNNYFPATYQPNFYAQNPYIQHQQMQQAPQAQQIPQQPVQQMPIQQSGFVRVQSENEARMYPVAPGNSVTFIDENAPYCYTKTMDMSQLDRPKFEKYRLVKEEDTPIPAKTGAESPSNPTQENTADFALKSDLTAIWREIDALKAKAQKQTYKKQESEGGTDE